MPHKEAKILAFPGWKKSFVLPVWRTSCKARNRRNTKCFSL